MILVTGATGNLGSALLTELHAGGAGPLRGFTRDAARAAFPEGVEAAHAQLAAFLGAEAADAVLDVTGGDVNDDLRRVRDTVPQLTGRRARSVRQWAAESAGAFR